MWDELDWQRWPDYQLAVWNRCNRLQVFTPRDAQAVQAMAPELAGQLRVNPFGIELPPPVKPVAVVGGAVPPAPKNAAS